MNGFDLNKVVSEWTGTNLNWKEDDLVWVASQDGGELIEYFKNLVKKMEVAKVKYAAEMNDRG
jgi:hypothetical protein